MTKRSEQREGFKAEEEDIDQHIEDFRIHEDAFDHHSDEIQTDLDDVEKYTEVMEPTHTASTHLKPEDEPYNDSNIDRLKQKELTELKSYELKSLNSWFEDKSPAEILRWGYEQFGSEMVMGTGFGVSGVVLIHTVSEIKLPLTIFYLDTSLLFKETYQLKDDLENYFEINFERVTTKLTVDQQASILGKELWKSDPDRCCYIRKVLPLRTYLTDKKAWVTGVRRDQSETRQKTRIFEWDPINEVIKINPLAFWSNEKVWEYIEKHNLPYNPLHDHGYPSIGCVPCTSPVSENSDIRSGRWEQQEKNECGIHIPSQSFQNGHIKNGSLGSNKDHHSTRNDK